MLGLGDDPFKFAAFRMMFRIFFTVFRFTNLTDSFHRAGGFAAVALVRLRVACISGADAGVGVVAVGLPLVPIMVGGVKRTVWLVAGCADRLSSTGGFAAGVRGIAILPRIDLHIAVFVVTLVPVMGRVRCPLLLPAVAGGRNRVRFGRAAYGTGIFSFARGRAGQLFRYRAIVPIMGALLSSYMTAGILFPVLVFVTLPPTQCSGVVVGVLFAGLGLADIAFCPGNAGGFADGAVSSLGVAGVAGAGAGVGASVTVLCPLAPFVTQNAAGFKGSLTVRPLGAQAANRAGLIINSFLRAAGAGFQVLLLCRFCREVVGQLFAILGIAGTALCLGGTGGRAAGTSIGFGGVAVLTLACPRVRTVAIGRPTPQMAQRRARLLIQMVVVIFDQIAGAHPVVQRVMRTVCG